MPPTYDLHVDTHIEHEWRKSAYKYADHPAGMLPPYYLHAALFKTAREDVEWGGPQEIAEAYRRTYREFADRVESELLARIPGAQLAADCTVDLSQGQGHDGEVSDDPVFQQVLRAVAVPTVEDLIANLP